MVSMTLSVRHAQHRLTPFLLSIQQNTSVFYIASAELLRRATLEHVQARPHAVLGLAMACADRMQSGMNCGAQPAPEAKMLKQMVNLLCQTFTSDIRYSLPDGNETHIFPLTINRFERKHDVPD